MGRVIDVYKTHLRYLPAVLFIIFLCNACVSYPPPISYEPLNLEGERQFTVSMDIESYEELVNNGSVLYVEFDQIGNRKYSSISITLYTLDKHRRIKIHDMEFEFENRVEIVRLNNTIRLRQQNPRLFIVEENPELVTEVFFEYIFETQNSIKINLHRVFKKTYVDIGKEIELTLRVNYSLDGGDIKTQEIKYLVDIYKPWWGPLPAEWLYWIIPGL
jgi:hypothetical protein